MGQTKRTRTVWGWTRLQPTLTCGCGRAAAAAAAAPSHPASHRIAAPQAHVPVPDQGAIEAALVERKKRELLERYVAAAERAAATTTTTAGVQGQ